MPRYTLERLDKKRHDRKRFTCGNDDLDGYLHKTARQAGDAGTAVCYVLIDSGDPGRIAGYFTLTQHAVDPGPENTALFERQPGIARTLAVPTTLLLDCRPAGCSGSAGRARDPHVGSRPG